MSSIRTGSRCTIFTKLPVAFCGGNRASVWPVPIVKPVIRPSNSCVPPYMSTSQRTALPDPQIGQLRLLEVGVDPDLRQRADRHQAFARPARCCPDSRCGA